MREPTIARNYADALLALARRADDLDGWGTMISDVAGAVQYDERLRRFLESPRVAVEEKNTILAKAFQDRFPRIFVRFLQAVVTHRRQHLIPEIAAEYHALVDEAEGRVHAQVTLAHEPDAPMREEITNRLARVMQKIVVPHFVIHPEILGGVVVRVGDTVMDGSVRRRLGMLRQHMLSTAAR